MAVLGERLQGTTDLDMLASRFQELTTTFKEALHGGVPVGSPPNNCVPGSTVGSPLGDMPGDHIRPITGAESTWLLSVC